jgi:hypothetical protein
VNVVVSWTIKVASLVNGILFSPLIYYDSLCISLSPATRITSVYRWEYNIFFLYIKTSHIRSGFVMVLLVTFQCYYVGSRDHRISRNLTAAPFDKPCACVNINSYHHCHQGACIKRSVEQFSVRVGHSEEWVKTVSWVVTSLFLPWV